MPKHSHTSRSRIGRQSALAHGMIREFGERALGVAEAEQDKAEGEAADAWGEVARIVARKLADRRFHHERQQDALRMADAATDPQVRKIHLARADLHAARARNA